MGFFWGCSCCVDYFILTTTEVHGYAWTSASPKWSITHGISYGANSTVGRKQADSDDTHLYFAGPISSAGSVLKLDFNGTVVDTFAYQATSQNPNGFGRTNDGDFVASGTLATPTEHVRKFDATGARTWGYSNTNAGQLSINTSDEVAHARQSGANFEIVKLDSSGSSSWTALSGTRYNTPRFDRNQEVVVSSQSGQLTKLDSGGSTVWTVTAATTLMGAIQGVAVTPENEIVICGPAASGPAGSRIAIYDEDGNELANSFRAGTTFVSAAVSTDGRIVVAGWVTATNDSIIDLYESDLSAGPLAPTNPTGRSICALWKGGLAQFWP